MVFGLNGKGFITPMMIRLKLENMFGEFGVCSLLTKVNFDRNYLFFSNEGDILDISQNMYQEVFSTICPLSNIIQVIYNKNLLFIQFKGDLRLLNINNVIPLSYGIQQLGKYGEVFFSIMPVKKLKEDKSNTNKQYSQLHQIESILKHIKSSDPIYNISFVIGQIPTSLGKTFKFVEIQSFKKETNRQKKKESIAQLRECIGVFLNMKNEGKVISEIKDSENSSMEGDSFQGKQVLKKNSTINKLESESLFKKQVGFQQKIVPQLNIQPDVLHSKQTDAFTAENKLTFGQYDIYSTYHFDPNSFLDLKHLIGEQEFAVHTERQDNPTDINSPQQTGKQTIENVVLNSEDHQSFIMKETERQLMSPKSPNDQQFLLNHDNQHQRFFVSKEKDERRVKQQLVQGQTYQSLMSDQINIQNNADLERSVALSVENSQLKLERYNKSMKTIVVKDNKKQGDRNKDVNQVEEEEQQTSLNLERNSTNDFGKDGDTGKKKTDRDVNSMQSSSHSIQEQKKKLVMKKIQSPSNTDGLRFFIVTGVVSFLSLLLLSSLQYAQQNTTLNNFYVSFASLNIFPVSLLDILRTLANSSYRQLNDSTKLYILPSDIILQENLVAEAESKKFQTSLEDEYMKIIRENSDQSYSTIFGDRIKLVLLYRDQFGVTQNSTLLDNIGLIYEFPFFVSSLNELQVSFSNTIELRQAWANYLQYNTTISLLQTMVENEANQQFDSLISTQYTDLVIILLVSALLSLTLIPLSICIKQQKEMMLKLFGSFTPEKLQSQIDIIEYCIQSIDSTNQDMRKLKKHLTETTSTQKKSTQNIKDTQSLGLSKQFQNNPPSEMQASHQSNITIHSREFNIIKRQLQKRNRSIASFSTLPKINKMIIGSAVVIVFALIIFPVITLVIVSRFRNEIQVVISERIIILNAQNHIFELQANHYSLWVQTILQTNVDVRQERAIFHIGVIRNIENSSNDIMASLNNLLTYTKQHTYDPQRFIDFYETVLKGNICDLILKNNQAQFDQDVLSLGCESISSGSLKMGLIVSYQKVSQIFQSLLSMYEDPNLNHTPTVNAASYIKGMQATENFTVDTHHLLRMLAFSFQALDNFSIQYLQDYHRTLTEQQNVVFVSSLSVIVLLFSFGWTFLYFNLRNNLTKSKRLLTLFHIDLIMENNLFLQYIKQNTFGTSR